MAGTMALSITDEELVSLLRQRAEAKMNRDYTTSDRVRATLENAGVKIHDARQAGMVGTWDAIDGRRYARTPNRYKCHSIPSARPRLTHETRPPSLCWQGEHPGPRLFQRPNVRGAADKQHRRGGT